MRFYSTNRQTPLVSFREALFTGQAPDGGLYMPASFPQFSSGELAEWAGKSYPEFAFEICRRLLVPEISETSLWQIFHDAYHFAPVLRNLDDMTFALELFHGPTLSFKDFGAQFMARCMGHFSSNEDQLLTILVATSGDTGSAVAHAYHRLQGVRVVLLYPSGMVSALQEKQLTALGDNIQVLEVLGSFDDCQALVKRAFADEDLRKAMRLSSANSINIGRLLPQSFYYFWGVAQILAKGARELIVCVPSGNFGNLTAGLFAQKMGLPVRMFIAAVNANAVVPHYLASGQFRPQATQRTLSNAMDVGNPSNWARIRDLYDDDHEQIGEMLWSTSVDDQQTIASIQRVYREFGYVIDPHTGVGFEAVQQFRAQTTWAKDAPCMVLSTAHPGKFVEIIAEALKMLLPLPDELAALEGSKPSIIQNDFGELKTMLLQGSSGD